MIKAVSHIRTLQFSKIAALSGFSHAITTRPGGCSTGAYASLNLGFHVDDDADTVRQNRRLLAESLGYDAENLMAAQQVHGDTVHLARQTDCGRGALDWDSAIPATDSLIVAEAGLPALILVADCAPILIMDPGSRAFAVVHAGWRSAVARIASKTVDLMQRELGVEPSQLLAGIGPHLCPDCFEIGPEVAQAAGAVAPAAVLPRVPKPHLDLAALITADLQVAGLLAHNIEVMPHCTRCENDVFFSHRAQGGTAGRFGLVAYGN